MSVRGVHINHLIFVYYVRVLSVSKMCANSLVWRSFMYAAHIRWNSLDLDIRLLYFDDFNKTVKIHL